MTQELAYTSFESSSGASVHRLPLEVFPNFWACAYLIQKNEFRVLIDAGSGTDQSHQDLLAGVQEAGYQVSDLTHILVTHAHIDHFGGLSKLRPITKARIGVHELDLQTVDHHEAKLALIGRRLASFLTETGLAEEQRDQLLSIYRFTKAIYESVAVDFTYEAARARRHHVRERPPAAQDRPEGRSQRVADGAAPRQRLLQSAAEQIAFPAGILQPPFFHKDYPTAVNYGGIGAVVGHELTHGFDDQGRKFDPQGVMQEWWAPEASAKFEAAAQCVDDQYSSFEVEPAIKVNGKLTLGENIADLGGLKQAYGAYKRWEARHGAPPPIAEGLSNEQLLFVAFGQVWCTVATPEYLRNQVTTEPHSPGRFRATGPPMNSAEFRRAFACARASPSTRTPRTRADRG